MYIQSGKKLLLWTNDPEDDCNFKFVPVEGHPGYYQVYVERWPNCILYMKNDETSQCLALDTKENGVILGEQSYWKITY